MLERDRQLIHAFVDHIKIVLELLFLLIKASDTSIETPCIIELPFPSVLKKYELSYFGGN